MKRRGGRLKIAVFAGTPRDTQMGIDVLKESGFESLAYPFSKNPEEQTKLQYYSKEELEAIFTEKIKDAKNKSAEKIFVYCNSLSSAVDYKKISAKENIEIITPLEAYKDIKDKKICILAANALAAYKIDKIIKDANKDADTLSIGMLRLVNFIEEKRDRQEIIEILDMKNFLKFLENIGTESLVLACTHFPYIKEELESLTSIKIIDPKDYMIKEIYKKR